jgi:diacylglycerol kinase family enzyme
MASPPQETALERAEELAERVLPDRSPKRRMLVIVNPYATTVSDRLKNLVVYALQGRYSVEAVETQARQHATQLCREAASEGYDVVVAFGGDGTVNEAANGLVGSGTPLTHLPGGSTNVFARTLGIPNDVVDATEHLLRMADQWEPRDIDTGRVNGRHFVFSAGIGLDASVVERVDAHPKLKARLGEFYFSWAAVSIFNRRYLFKPPRLRVTVGDRELSGVTVIVQNSDPFTYFGTRPIHVGREVSLESGSLALTVLRRATPLEVPTLIPRLFSKRGDSVAKHRQVDSLVDVKRLVVETEDGRPFPLEVDGDFIGEIGSAEFEVAAGSLRVVS